MLTVQKLTISKKLKRTKSTKNLPKRPLLIYQWTHFYLTLHKYILYLDADGQLPPKFSWHPRDDVINVVGCVAGNNAIS